LVIASYAEISLSKKKKSLLHEIHWSRVIFDEAHHLRNANTSRFRGAKCIRADIRWLVSGTPIQNRKQDFYALCNVLGLPTSYYTDSENLRELTKHFLLKRSKKSVGLEISEICVENVIVPWKNEKEKNLSRDIHCMSYSKNVISMLLKARQSCTLPRLLSNHLSGLMKSGILTQSYKEGLLSTSKLDAVIQNIVERKGNGNGKIVFCHFKEEIQEVAKRLKEKEMNVGIIDGRVTIVSRNALLKEQKDVLILQIQTCCEGLNLQENYSEVFFVSPHWNPFIEDQAVARCHRMGQKKVVFVKRYEMDEFDAESDKNVERYVNEVQESKRLIVESVMS
jgi:non-specific serine/threonine protein kinase